MIAAGLVASVPAAGAADSLTAWGASETTSWTQLSGWFSTPKYPPDQRYTPPADSTGGSSFGGTTYRPQAAASPGPSGGDFGWLKTPQNEGLGGILSEIRIGALIHDSGPVSSSTEEGADINFEVLLTSPEIFKYLLWARPHFGGSINTEGDTSQGYFGLTWTADIYEHFFLEFSFGGSVHDGDLVESADRNGLGCRLLFRESISAGVIFDGHHNLSLMYDHISNGGLCDDNDGLDTFGVRYGYRF